MLPGAVLLPVLVAAIPHGRPNLLSIVLGPPQALTPMGEVDTEADVQPEVEPQIQPQVEEPHVQVQKTSVEMDQLVALSKTVSKDKLLATCELSKNEAGCKAMGDANMCSLFASQTEKESWNDLAPFCEGFVDSLSKKAAEKKSEAPLDKKAVDVCESTLAQVLQTTKTVGDARQLSGEVAKLCSELVDDEHMCWELDGRVTMALETGFTWDDSPYKSEKPHSFCARFAASQARRKREHPGLPVDGVAEKAKAIVAAESLTSPAPVAASPLATDRQADASLPAKEATASQTNATAVEPLADSTAAAPATQTLAAATEAPVAATEAPVAATEAPVAATEAPVAATEAPVAATEAPVAATEAPVASSPVVAEATTAAPVHVTSAPASLTNSSVSDGAMHAKVATPPKSQQKSTKTGLDRLLSQLGHFDLLRTNCESFVGKLTSTAPETFEAFGASLSGILAFNADDNARIEACSSKLSDEAADVFEKLALDTAEMEAAIAKPWATDVCHDMAQSYLSFKLSKATGNFCAPYQSKFMSSGDVPADVAKLRKKSLTKAQERSVAQKASKLAKSDFLSEVLQQSGGNNVNAVMYELGGQVNTGAFSEKVTSSFLEKPRVPTQTKAEALNQGFAFWHQTSLS